MREEDKKTTIILGAGASTHYGFPTGEGLINSIIESAKYTNWYPIGGDYYLNEIYKARRFSKLLEEYDPLSIDRFLTLYSGRKEIVEIGKKLIAHEIIKRQKYWLSSRKNKENWYKYLYDFIFPDNDYLKKIEQDNFRIITFNYDLSLEYFFNSRLEKTPSLKEAEAWELFKKFHSKIHHVYGSVYDYTKISEVGFECKENSNDRYSYFLNYADKANHSRFQETSDNHNNIKIIGEEREASEETKKFREYLKDSQNIFVLGFGFDDVNSSLIGLEKDHINNFRKKIYCTNYNNLKIIAEKIDNLTDLKHITEISEKTVHAALSEDFRFI